MADSEILNLLTKSDIQYHSQRTFKKGFAKTLIRIN